jgi:hypothetical protein
MSNTTIATKTLPATLTTVPANFPWTLGRYQADPYLGSASVELLRDGKMVGLAKNDGRGGGSEIEIWTRGDESIFTREAKAIEDVLNGFKEAGLKYRSDGSPFGLPVSFLEYNEEHLADLLLAEADQIKNLARGRNILFAKNRANLTKGTFHTLRKSSHLSEAQGLEAIKKHFPSALMWSRATHQWIEA